MQPAKVTYLGRPHVYVESDLQPNETLGQWRVRQDARRRAQREQAKRTKARVIASLLHRS
jgi:hypothetical protein